MLTAIYNQEISQSWSLQQNRQYFLRAVDLDLDGSQEYLWIKKQPGYTALELFYLQNGEWKLLYLGTSRTDQDKFDQALLSGDIEVVPSRWNDLEIGDQRFRVGLED